MERIITLGTDAEFEVIVDGDVVPVEKLMSVSDVALPWGRIGQDGSGDPIELRPEPSPDPETLVGNLGRLLLCSPRVVGGVPSTACEVFPIGGHVHIGGVPSEVQEDLAGVIDGLLGDFFYSLSGETRLRAGYGKRGDWRVKAWGFEYRTPPASLWSHPGVALTFLRAIKWVVEKFLADEDPLGDPAWAAVRMGAKRATDFVKAYRGCLHWGAWKAHVGEIALGEAGVDVYTIPTVEADEGFFDDLRTMCARIGLPFVNVLPLHRKRGDYASNVPGYGELVGDFEPYRPGGRLGLSWRFRNDPEFRKVEMARLERALARILEGFDDIGQRDGGLLVREAVPFSVEWPLEVEAGKEEELRVPDGGSARGCPQGEMGGIRRLS